MLAIKKTKNIGPLLKKIKGVDKRNNINKFAKGIYKS